MSEYRKIHYPICPYCYFPFKAKFGDYQFSDLVEMATGRGDDDVVIKCGHCDKRYRVTCSIKYNSRKLKEQKR